MLILTRNIGEEIYIDKGLIQIKILFVKNELVGVGINAPLSVEVDRKEIFMSKYMDQEMISKDIANA